MPFSRGRLVEVAQSAQATDPEHRGLNVVTKETTMMKPFRVAALAVLVTTASLAAAVQQTGSSKASFIAKGPAGLKIVGDSSEVKVADKGKMVVITVPLKTVKTGIDLRDHHMLKALKAIEHPDAAKNADAVLELDR